jgi:excinuclease ABC subunit C
MHGTSEIHALLEAIPESPGCYLMKDAAGEVLYVGKAVNLRSRIRSYFHASANHNRRTAEMVAQIADIDTIVVGSEIEALILEMNLIKRHRPKYNVRLKDDKRYPYIRVHWNDAFPKLTVTRQVVDDGSRFFGPYTSMWAVHQTLDVLRKIFPYLTCDRTITGRDARACLYYDIKLCLAPCIGVVDRESYREMIADLCRFLQGRDEAVVERLQKEMARAAAGLEYERAAAIRDQLAAIGKIVESQRVVSQEKIDSDVIAFARQRGEACVEVLFIRGGKLIGHEHFMLEGGDEAEEREIAEAFVQQFYAKAAYVPQRVLLPVDVEEQRILETWLSHKRGGNEKVEIVVPRRGAKKDLVRMAAANAAQTLSMLRARWEADRSKHVEALAQLQEALGLAVPPNRIECYDVSNLQGTAATGSMVVFEQGAPNRKLYRHFTIKTVHGQDDFASMEEILMRRLRRWQAAIAEAKRPGAKPDPSFGILPDLLIVDGGKGQLGRAVAALQAFGLQDKVNLAGLAKAYEEVYLPGRANALVLPRGSEGLFLVQRVRDEAHRFALSHHHARRKREGLASQIDAIPGIGPAKRKALLEAFGDVDRMRQASIEQLTSVRGISPQLAERVKAAL